MSENESPGASTLPPPDISKDRLYLIQGGCMVTRADTHVAMLDAAPAWVTLVPVESCEAEQRLGADKVYPRETHVRVMHTLTIGTVDELVADFREKLVRCWEAVTYKPKEGEEQPVIPQFGEPSMRKQNDVLARNGITKFTEAFHVDRKKLDDHEKRRVAMTGFHPQQDAYTRDLLMRLVAIWVGRRYPDEADVGKGVLPPTDSVERLDRLIRELTILKQDRLAAEAQKDLVAETTGS